MPRILLFMLLSLLATPAIRSDAAPSSGNTTAIQRGAVPSDAQIDATIRAKLAKSKIGKDGFRFKVQRGVVTWEGSTDVMQHKGSATRMAKSAGALQVINNIHVNGASRPGTLKKAVVQD